ncbi:MAG: hypothetical protein A2V93_02475 [Ignavibacteria bacterium RBG_16_34_14]|nr:MAG: hypothetical protein A2V93_02475 [Ignavibacteria bacterium RBG_16_34_14]
MKRLILVVFVAACGNIFPQVWQQLATPQGGGVTDMVYCDLFGSTIWDGIWVTTSSENWPTGQWGGVRLSTNNGQSWLNISSGYIARTLEVGQDGNLYASIWYDPAFQSADGLYRFTPQVGVFGILYQASAGDNIFSIAVKNTPHTIFAGTRNGVIRSTDNGTTFGYSNTGIPDSAWVYDIAIDSTGILAIASSKGVFISTDNGDNWQQAAGIAPEDTVVTLTFVDETGLRGGSYLYGGTKKEKLYKAAAVITLVTFSMIYSHPELVTFVEILSLFSALKIALRDIRLVAKDNVGIDPQTVDIGGVFESTDGGNLWQSINEGLPPNPPISALTMREYSDAFAELYAGLFKDTTWGAEIYKLGVTVDVEETIDQIPSDYKLEQNYPNPFNPSTTIQFAIPKESFTKLEVFNSLGEKVAALVSETLSAGTYEYEWNAEGLPSGIYLYRLQTPNYSESRKMILIK